MYSEEERAEWRKMFKEWKETGKSPWNAGKRVWWEDNKQKKAVQEWVNEWKTRATTSKVLKQWNKTGKKPQSESSNEYTKRRIAEETKRTWLSDAADIAGYVKEGILAVNPYTAASYFGAKVGQDILNGNVDANTALNAAFAVMPGLPKFTIPKQIGNAISNSVYKGMRKLGASMAFANDVTLRPFETFMSRINGDYPLTYAERKKYVKKIQDIENSGIFERGRDYEKIQRLKRVELIRDAEYPDVEDAQSLIAYPNWKGMPVKINRHEVPSNVISQHYTKNGTHIIEKPFRNKAAKGRTLLTREPSKNWAETLQHEFTHSLLADKAYSPFLNLSTSKFWNTYGYYSPDLDILKNVPDHPFGTFEDAANIREMIVADAKVKGINPPSTFKHNISPNEAVADLRGQILEKGKIDYKYFKNEYGLSEKDIDWMINNGY